MKIIRSNRKSLALEISPREGLIVRISLRTTQAQVEKFINEHRDWIESHLQKMQERQEALANVDKLSMDEIKALADKALKVIPERVRHYASLLGVTYGRITIRNQRSRWGSCSQKKILTSTAC